MKKFTKIKQYCDVVEKIRSNWDYIGKDANNKPIRAHNSPYPVIEYTGTIKLHGVNAGVEIGVTDRVLFQSRFTSVDSSADAINFYPFASRIDWLEYFGDLKGFVIYGEWCKADPSNITAIHRVGPIFVIIAVRAKLNNDYIAISYVQKLLKTKLAQLNKQNVWFINQFPTYSITIDFNNPDDVTNYIDCVTAMVDIECPVAKQLGVSGPGEGIVWGPTSGYKSGLVFKTKGRTHSSTRRNLPTKAVVVKTESASEFVYNTCTINRLRQGISVLTEQRVPITKDNIGTYIVWVINDILSEENLLLVASGLCKKDVTRKIGVIAKDYWFNEITNNSKQ